MSKKHTNIHITNRGLAQIPREESIDEAAMKEDGVLDKYKTKETVTYRLTPKERKE